MCFEISGRAHVSGEWCAWWWVVMVVREEKAPNGSVANRVFLHFRNEKINVFENLMEFIFVHIAWLCVPATECDLEIGLWLCMSQVVHVK